jgi:hypothetical protein
MNFAVLLVNEVITKQCILELGAYVKLEFVCISPGISLKTQHWHIRHIQNRERQICCLLKRNSFYSPENFNTSFYDVGVLMEKHNLLWEPFLIVRNNSGRAVEAFLSGCNRFSISFLFRSSCFSVQGFYRTQSL